MSIEFTYSVRGRKGLGRWYPRPDRISVFLNKIAEVHSPDDDFDGFVASLNAVEFHELGHIYGYRGGCKKCNGCYYCKLTDFVEKYLRYGVWHGYYKIVLKNLR